MRVFGYIVSFFIVLSAVLYMVLFTNGGNNLLKPYVKKYIQKRLNQKVVINSMILKPNFVDFEILINNQSKVVVNGDFSLFDKKFDINYKVNLINIKTPYMYIKSRISLDGDIKGEIKNYIVRGNGKLFRANTSFLVSLDKKRIKTLKIDAKNIRPEEIFSLLNLPIYTQGMMDINADFSSLDGKNFNGVAKSTIYYGILNNNIIKEEFGLGFDSAVTYKGKINTTIKDGLIKGSGELFSNLAKLKFKNSDFDIKTENFSSDFTLFVPNLKALKPLIKQTLVGDITLKGDVRMQDKILSARVTSKKFGGDITAILTDKTANLNFTNLRSDDILKMLGDSRYFSSKIDGEVELPDISKSTFISDIRVREGRFRVAPMRELLDVKLPINNNFSLHINSFKKDGNITTKANFVSSMFDLIGKDIKFDVNSSEYNGRYIFSVKDLSSISFLTKRKLRGELNIEGDFRGDEQGYRVDGQSKFLDANSSFVLKNGIADINISDIRTAKLLYMAYLPEIFDSNASANVTYDILSGKGNFSAKAVDGRLRRGELSDLVYTITKYDLTSELYDDTTLDGTIDKNIVKFNFLAKSNNSDINITNADINLETKQIDSKFGVKVGDKDLNGKIKGAIENPKIDIKSSQYLKKKIEKIIDKKVPQNLRKPIKNLLNLFG